MKNFELLGSNAPYIRYPLEHFFDVQKKLGVKNIDFVLQAPHIYIDSSKTIGTEKVKRLMSENKIKILAVTVCPYRYTVCAGQHSIQAEKSKAYFKQCILTAEALEANYVCITAEGGCFDKNKSEMLAYAVHESYDCRTQKQKQYSKAKISEAFVLSFPEQTCRKYPALSKRIPKGIQIRTIITKTGILHCARH